MIELIERKVSDLERDSRRNSENFVEREFVVGRWKFIELFVVVSFSELGSLDSDLEVSGFSISSWCDKFERYSR